MGTTNTEGYLTDRPSSSNPSVDERDSVCLGRPCRVDTTRGSVAGRREHTDQRSISDIRKDITTNPALFQKRIDVRSMNDVVTAFSAVMDSGAFSCVFKQKLVAQSRQSSNDDDDETEVDEEGIVGAKDGVGVPTKKAPGACNAELVKINRSVSSVLFRARGGLTGATHTNDRGGVSSEVVEVEDTPLPGALPRSERQDGW